MKILFISHDANRAGAQIFLLNIMQYFQKKQMPMHLLLLGGGTLEKDFEQICPVSKYPQESSDLALNFSAKVLKKLKLKERKSLLETAREELWEKFRSENFDCIYTNTVATAWVLPALLSHLKLPLITHIHELEFSIQLYSSKENRDFLFQNTTRLIACSKAVAENLIENHQLPSEKVEVIHSFVQNEDVLIRASNANCASIRKKYGIPENAFLIGGCGNAEWRKGLDIFVQLAKSVLSVTENIHFTWVGVRKEGEYYEQVIFDASRMGILNNITFIEPTPEAIEIINCFDIFTIVSREDPFPLVMLEAALSQRTIFGFENTGGCSEFIEGDAGLLFPYLDIQGMAQAIANFKEKPSAKWGERAKEKVLNQYSFENSILKIEKLLENLS